MERRYRISSAGRNPRTVIFQKRHSSSTIPVSEWATVRPGALRRIAFSVKLERAWPSSERQSRSGVKRVFLHFKRIKYRTAGYLLERPVQPAAQSRERCQPLA
jgi:hypothetical protein